jgi:hypothetical protein
MQPDDYDSFLVRLWRDTVDNEALPTWRGEIEHIQSGTRREVTTLGALLAFLCHATVSSPHDAWHVPDEPS